MRWISRTRGLLVTGALCLVSQPVPAGFDRHEPSRPAETTLTVTRLAQANPLLTVDQSVTVKPGETVKLPARFAGAAASPAFNLVVRPVPDWMTLSEADFVGSGVWLVRSARLPQVNLVAKPNAPAGPVTLAVALVSGSGEIVSEQKLLVTVTSTDSAPTATAPATAPPQRVAQVGKTWEQLVNPGQPAPQAKQAAPARAAPAESKSEAQLLGYARHLVRECTTCHSLYGQDVGIPPMIGLSRDRFMETMDLYRTNKRDNQAMVDIAKSLNEEETLALAIYLGRIRPPTPEEVSGSGRTAGGGPPLEEVSAARRSEPSSQDRVARWISRGKQLLDAGDIAQARLFFKRAAEYGNAQAAVYMANSYDPNVLPWRPGMGLEAEPLKARQWYQHAVKLGAGAEAENRLAELPRPR